MLSSTHMWVCDSVSKINTLDLRVKGKVMLTGGQRCSQTATVQSGAALSVCMCSSSFSWSPQRGRKWACACGPVKPSLSSALAPLPRSASRCGLSRFFLVWIEISIMSALHYPLFSSPFSFAVLSSLFMQLIQANEPVQAQSAFYERDSHIFTEDIKPHITTAQMEQRHMTDKPHSEKNESMRTVSMSKPDSYFTHYCCLFSFFFSSLVHLCPSSN